MNKKIIENRRCPFNTVTDTKIMWALALGPNFVSPE